MLLWALSIEIFSQSYKLRGIKFSEIEFFLHQEIVAAKQKEYTRSEHNYVAKIFTFYKKNSTNFNLVRDLIIEKWKGHPIKRYKMLSFVANSIAMQTNTFFHVILYVCV